MKNTNKNQITVKQQQLSKSIKIMGDYCSSGLWNGRSGTMIDYDELNISNNLKNKITNWQKKWEIFNSFFLKEWSYKPRKLRKKDYFSKYSNWIEKELEIIGILLKKELPYYNIFTFSDRILSLENGRGKHLKRVILKY